MRVAITGANGKMGKILVEIAHQDKNIESISKVNKGDDLKLLLNDFDVLIDFTRPEATLNYLEICKNANKKVIVGTTGFNDKELEKINYFANYISIVLAPNMSVGVNLTLKLLELTAKVIGDAADIEIIEAHHRYKVDAPSGTALKMGEAIANTLSRDLKKCAVYGREGIEKARDKKTIGFSTIRAGDIVGEHTVLFALDGERIEISHKASSRVTFAKGAMRAARWIKTKANGIYSMQDVLDL